MKIQQSMLRSYHAFAKFNPLISVTFSTPTPGYITRPVAWRLFGYRILTLNLGLRDAFLTVAPERRSLCSAIEASGA
jgi:hypothetical protein